MWTPPVAVQDHRERYVLYADGTATRDVNVTLTEEQYRQMAQGYRCCRCYGIVQEAFPVSCGFPGCDGYPDGFPMRERQRQVLEEEFDGLEWIGLSPETAARLENEADKAIWTPKGR